MLKKLFILTFLFLNSANINSDWVQVSSGVLQPNINAITATGNYIFAGTNVTFQGGGVFRSSNHGINWEQIHFTTTLTLASNSTYVYRGYQNGFSYSSNYGLTWIASGGPSRWILSLLTDSNFVYQGCFTTTPTTNQGVWISSNNGINWTQTMLNNINIYCLTKSENYLFAGGYTFGVGGGVFLTTNNGQSWTNPLSIAGDALASFGNYIYTGGGSNTGFFLSTNYGQNWAQTSLNNVSVYVLTSYENNVFAGTSSGFWVSNNNGLNWIQRNEGMIGLPPIN
jgi:hypothetical protein